jgi:hypothetical protein
MLPLWKCGGVLHKIARDVQEGSRGAMRSVALKGENALQASQFPRDFRQSAAEL